jgi:hypothetical protein
MEGARSSEMACWCSKDLRDSYRDENGWLKVERKELRDSWLRAGNSLLDTELRDGRICADNDWLGFEKVLKDC